MSESDYLIAFYSVIVGLTATVYVKKWGELLQMRTYALYTTVPVLWSLCFFLIVINEWFLNYKWEADTNEFMFLMSLLIPFIFYFIGMLIFPRPDMLDRKDKFAYLDYFEYFLKQKTLIISLALLAFVMKYISVWFVYDDPKNIFLGFPDYLFHKRNYMVFLALLIALFTNNKLILLISSITILYVWINTWVYITV